MPSLWRISNYASLAGEGGLQYSGRWHTKGRRIVYLAESPAGALIETLVHLELDETRLPRSYKLLEIKAPDDLKIESITMSAGNRWKSQIELTRRAGDKWLQSGKTALARVPSAIAPNTWNVLLNPDHPDARQVQVLKSVTAQYDPRLFPTMRVRE
jgi:RES domain-containing protein